MENDQKVLNAIYTLAMHSYAVADDLEAGITIFASHLRLSSGPDIGDWEVSIRRVRKASERDSGQ